MLITRESDYGIRTIRALACGKKMNIAAICEQEDIPRQFAYKILKELSRAGIVSIVRGVSGGYILTADLEKLTLYDVISVIDSNLFINKCMEQGYVCERNPDLNPCRIHQELARIQNIMEKELKKTPIRDLI